MKQAEILAPAGNEEAARIALLCGADAIYLGLTRFSARSGADNFDEAALVRTAEFAHLLGKKVYVCLNTLIKDSETEEFFAAARSAYLCGADAVLMQDLFLGRALKDRYPQISLHLSTQAGCCNEWGARIAKEHGFSRVVLARETPLAEIERISAIIETEVFVQGALCACFSGQCYLSSFAGNNSGNRGRCKQPCRMRYSIDRKGFESPAFALSPCDLSVGERVKELLGAGAVSLKIEGRLRRSEYVAAAVAYYRAILGGGNAEEELSDLKRAYNRGDYTAGLTFGQQHFLSRKIQGHIGERVGTLDGNLFCKSDYAAKKEDGFKILRAGKEVGGAVLDEKKSPGKGGFYLTSREKLKENDEVRLTSDSRLLERVFKEHKRRILLEIELYPGKPAKIACGEFVFCGSVFEAAKSAPLTAEELAECFRKVGDLPFLPEFSKIETENVFAPKSKLNSLRREFYDALKQFLLPAREPLSEIALPPFPVLRGKGSFQEKTAIIAENFEGLDADILIYKPKDYAKIPQAETEKGTGEKFLFLPPFFTAEDLAPVKKVLKYFDGIYCDGAYGLLFAKEQGCKFFAGTGLNLTNRYAVEGVLSSGAAYFALSKEISKTEQDALAFAGAFALKEGAVKVMDLCFCPFECDCQNCDGRGLYSLTDEAGRRFPLRRYRTAEKHCRFELYNCAPLSGGGDLAGTLIDRSVKISAAPTKGHSERSMR